MRIPWTILSLTLTLATPLAAQAPDSTCAAAVRPVTDALRAETYRRSSSGSWLAPRATVVRQLATRVDSVAETCLTRVPTPPPDTTPPYTISVRQPDSVLAIPPGIPNQTSIRATVDSAGIVVADSARLSLAPALVTATWDASVRRWRVHTPTAPGTVVLTWEYRGATHTSALTITGAADTTTPPPPPPVDTTTPPPAPAPAGVELPRSVPRFPAALATAACTQTLAATGLQAALGAARPGDVLCLAAGDRFRGTLTLPPRADSGWVVVRTAPTPGQPAPGERVRPAHQATLATLATTAGGSAATVRAARGARGWYLALLEVTIEPAVTTILGTIVELPRGSSDLVLDRVLVRAGATQQVQRCVALNSASTAILHSWLDECHAKGFDSQAIVTWESDGPVLISNNTLAGAGENIMLGGADPSTPGVVPQDWTIVRNHIVTPLAWKGVWTKKNLFETKNARRILVESNVLEGSWADGQVGYAFLLKTANQSGSCTWCSANDLTIRRNLILRAGGAVGITGREGGNTNKLDSLLRRLEVSENYADSIGLAPYSGAQQLVSIMQGAADVTVSRNTLTGTAIKNDLSVAIPPSVAAVRFVFDGNVLSRGTYPLHGCNAPILNCLPGATITGNVFVGAAISGAPVGITTAPTLADAIARAGSVSRATIDAAVRGVVVTP